MKKIWWAGAVFFIFIAVFLTLILTKQKAHADFPSNNYCGVSFEDPVYEFKDSAGNSLFVLDNSGNLYIKSSAASKVYQNYLSPISQPSGGFGFKMNSDFKAAFSNSNNVYLKGGILENQIIPSAVQNGEMVFKDPLTQSSLALFDANTGTLYIKGKAIYYSGQSGCLEQDEFTLSGGSYIWKEIYCDMVNCAQDNIDLDTNQTLCTDHGNYWNIGGDSPMGTACCEDDTNADYKKTLTCGAGKNMCITNSDDDACCDQNSDCVFNSACTSATAAACSPWNSALKVGCNAGSWTFTAYCPDECVSGNKCRTTTTCSSGSCSGSQDCTQGTMCDSSAHNGCQSGQCNTARACSSGEGDNKYGDNGGKYYCRATCDGSGSCDYATDCTDCSTSGSVSGCACACAGYGVAESIANNNCEDVLDNDCDSSIDYAETDCKKSNGIACNGNLQCLSGFCVDGYCCNSACTAPSEICRRCDISGSLGTCSPIASGLDPDSECPSPAATCALGCATGTCNGAGACGAVSSGEGSCPICGRCTDNDVECDPWNSGYHDSGCTSTRLYHCNCNGAECGSCSSCEEIPYDPCPEC